MRVIPAADVHRALHNANLVERMRTAFRSETVRLSADSMAAASHTGNENSVGTTIAWIEERFVGVRIKSTFPENQSEGRSPDMGLYVLLSGRNGDALAMIDGPALFAWARAAEMGLAASYFARPDCERLLLIGVAPDLRPILQTFDAMWPIAHVLIWDPDMAKAQQAASVFDKEDRRVNATGDLEAAIRGAHIICQVDRLAAFEMKSAWLPSGAHLSVQGPAVGNGTIVLDSWANIRASVDQASENGLDAGSGKAHVPADIFHVSRGEHPGRASYGERTAFVQSGTGLEDLISAITVLELT